MKNLIKADKAKILQHREDFVKSLRKEKDVQTILSKWYYNHLIPSTSKFRKWESVKELKNYLILRQSKQEDKKIIEQALRVQTVASAGDFDKITVTIEWKKSRMWGSNPSAEAVVDHLDGTRARYCSGSIGGCGYDKESTAIAQAVNQCNEFLKALYLKKDKNMKKDNRDLFGYGSGSGIFPMLEGGVGVSCYPKIFDKIGYTFNNVASGKTFDVYVIQRKK